MAKYELTSKNYNKLFAFAKQSGLEVQHQMKSDALIGVIQAAFPDIAEVELVEDDEHGTSEPALVLSGETGQLTAHYRDDPKVVINIATDDENGGNRPVPVCVNGDWIWIKRNTDVAIPYRFFLSLRDAVQTNYTQEEGPNHSMILIAEERTAFRYNVVEPASKADIAAWHERTKDLGRDKSEIEALKPVAQPTDSGALAMIAEALQVLASQKAAA